MILEPLLLLPSICICIYLSFHPIIPATIFFIQKVGVFFINFLTFDKNWCTVITTMPDAQPSFLRNDQELLQAAKDIDPQILRFFRLVEQPYRGGPDFRYLYTTDQVQEVLIQAVQLSVSRTGPFSLTGPYGTRKSTIITRMFSLLDSQP